MTRTPLPFDNFNNLMKSNWSDTHRSLILLFPKLEKISEYLTFHIAALMEENGLLGSDFHVLTAIRRSQKNPPYELKPSEICQYMLVSWGGLNKIMNRLEEHDMICRIESTHDKRIRMARLTPAGQHFIEQAVTKIQQLHQVYLTDFNQEEIQVFDKLIAKLLNNIEGHSTNKPKLESVKPIS